MSDRITQTALDALATTAVREVLARQFQVEACAATPDLTARGADAATLGASVPLTGSALRGAVSLRLSPALARLLVERLVGQACGSPAEAQDLCQELCNILAGRMAATLGHEGAVIELGTPSLLGPHMTGDTAPAADLIHSSHWLCEHEPLVFALELRTIP